MSEITPNTPNPVREDAYVEELAEKLGIEPQYIPKSPVWRNEEEIKAIAEMFANMQGGGGSGGGVLVVHDVEGTLDKTWQEIHDAMLSGGAAIQVNETEVYAVLRVYEGKGTYVVICTDGGAYSASSASGYPTFTIN